MQNNDTGILFLSLLAILCQVFVIGTGALGLVSIFSLSARRRLKAIFTALSPLATPFAFCVALVTMLGSLYMSEVRHFTPCHLCWIQRSLLYPQVLWTLILWIKPNLKALRYLALVMLIIDVPVSIYHYLLEWYPDLETSVCNPKIPCSLEWFRNFHYIDLPLMALTSAVTVFVLLVASSRTLNSPTK